MIFSIENNKVKKIKIGNMFPETGEISCPYFWGTDDIENFISNTKRKNKFEIDRENPEELFELMEIK